MDSSTNHLDELVVKFRETVTNAYLLETERHDAVQSATALSDQISQSIDSLSDEHDPLQPHEPTIDPNIRLAEAVEALCSRIDQMSVNRAAEVAQYKTTVIELSLAVATHIVKLQMQSEMFELDGVVETLIQQAGLDSPTSIFFHPHDIARLKEGFQESLVSRDIKIVPDSQLSRGHFRIQNQQTQLTNQVHETIAQIREILHTEATENDAED